MEVLLTPIEALNYLNDIAHGRKMSYNAHELKLIIENAINDNYFYKHMISRICDFTGLDIEPLKDLVKTENAIINYICESFCFRVDAATYKNKSKAFDIIKKKRVDVDLLLLSQNVDVYNDMMESEDRLLTKEEYDSLKKEGL